LVYGVAYLRAIVVNESIEYQSFTVVENHVLMLLVTDVLPNKGFIGKVLFHLPVHLLIFEATCDVLKDPKPTSCYFHCKAALFKLIFFYICLGLNQNSNVLRTYNPGLDIRVP
jgi:hypothetical protein